MGNIMQRATPRKLIIESLRQDAYVLQNAVILSSELKKSWKDEEETTEFIIQLFPNPSSSSIQMGAYYPVIFDDETSEKNIEMNKALRTHLGYTEGTTLPPYNLVPIDKIKQSAAECINIEVVSAVGNKNHRIERGKLLDAIKKTFTNYPFCKGQILLLSFEGVTLTLKVNGIAGDFDMGYYSLKNDTALTLNENKNSNVELYDSFADHSLTVDFTDKGLAGLKTPVSKINQALAARKVPSKLLSVMGKKPQQLMLFHGETGTGKTALATAMMQKLSNTSYTLHSTHYSEETLQSFFLQAQKAWSQDANGPTYTLLIDEIDQLPAEAISTLISYLEGKSVTPNLLVIGTTNKELTKLPYSEHLINLAVCIPFEPPTLQGRQQILRLKMANMEQHGLLDKSVDISDLASRTDGYTPLQLERLIALAQDYALADNFTVSLDQRHFNYRDDIKEVSQAAKLTKDHFERALCEITPIGKVTYQPTVAAPSSLGVLGVTGSPLHRAPAESPPKPRGSEPEITIHTLKFK